MLSRPKINVDDIFDEDLQLARRRAERAITDDTFFDSRGANVQQTLKQHSAQAEDDIDEEVNFFFYIYREILSFKQKISNDIFLFWGTHSIFQFTAILR